MYGLLTAAYRGHRIRFKSVLYRKGVWRYLISVELKQHEFYAFLFINNRPTEDSRHIFLLIMTKKEAIVKSICCHLDVVFKSKSIINNPALLGSLKNLFYEMQNYLEETDGGGFITQDFEIINYYISEIENIQNGLHNESDELNWLKKMALFIKSII